MEIHWADGRITLERADDFKAFKVVVQGAETPWHDVASAFSGLARFDGGTAWISQQGLIDLAGAAASPSWRDGFAAMVAKARPFGWIEEATGDIKAHVERR